MRRDVFRLGRAFLSLRGSDLAYRGSQGCAWNNGKVTKLEIRIMLLQTEVLNEKAFGLYPAVLLLLAGCGGKGPEKDGTPAPSTTFSHIPGGMSIEDIAGEPGFRYGRRKIRPGGFGLSIHTGNEGCDHSRAVFKGQDMGPAHKCLWRIYRDHEHWLPSTRSTT